ncbi:MAG: V-type ATP synthase subunit C [Methanosarcinales archaeon]
MKYAYITGRVRAMKAKLIPATEYPKLLQMEISEIARYMEETEYKKDIDELARFFHGVDLIEYALNANLARTYRKLIEVSTEEPKFLIMEYMRRWDVWNIKTLLRGKYYNAPENEILESLVPAGQLGKEILDNLVKKSMNEIIQFFEGTAYYDVLKNYDGGVLAPIENALDKLYYYRMERTIGTLSSETALFSKFIRTEIDIKNIQTLFRMKIEDIAGDIVMDNLIPGGLELKDDLNRLANMTFSEFLKTLEGYSFWNAISDIVREDMTSVSSVGTLLKKYLVDYAWKISNYNPLSILPVLGYIVSKYTEVSNIRIIVRGKELGLSEEIIKNQLVI